MLKFFSSLGTGRLIGLGVCGFLAALAFFLKFMVPGYSFSALVCLGIIAVILFYVFMPLLAPRFPRLTALVLRCFTVVLVIGVLAAGLPRP